MSTLHRRAGDHGPLATIRLRIRDAEDNPVVSGTTVLRISKGTDHVADHPMTHDTDGWWEWEPADGDLKPGDFRLTVHSNQVTLPAQHDIQLRVRERLPGPQ